MNYIKKILETKSTGSIDDYVSEIYSRCEKGSFSCMNPHKSNCKVSADTMSIPTFFTYDMILTTNYNVQQLKSIAKSYKLKVSGNKKEIQTRIFIFLKLSSVIIKIQKIFRGRLQRNYNIYHGPAFKNRELCTNDSDFLTGDEMKTMPYPQFFSYKDTDGFVYGFDLISLYNLISKSGKIVKNPYNRNNIPPQVIQDMKRLMKLSKVLRIYIEIDIIDVMQDISPQKNIELRTLDLFQNIDALGNYSDPAWFSSLSRIQLIKFARELIDIWNYRAQLSINVKRAICPPNGEPFRLLNFQAITHENNIDKIKKTILDILEIIVNRGIDRDSQSLGAYYVLAALTLVNENTATALPWLYQSVSYY